jgi:hypothetical protein
VIDILFVRKIAQFKKWNDVLKSIIIGFGLDGLEGTSDLIRFFWGR